jgi:hypothetical protein
MERKKCMFRIYLTEEEALKYNKLGAGWYQCPFDSCGGITRTKELCSTHFVKLKRDNQMRHERNIEITEDVRPLRLTKSIVRGLKRDEKQEA